MEVRAYNEMYLDDAMTAMGTMLDYAANYQQQNIDDFFQNFLNEKSLSKKFESGDPGTIAGKSGVDLYCCVTGDSCKEAPVYIEFDRSPEYWVGWALAYSQWYMNRSFRELIAVAKPSDLLLWYPIHHEMDVSQVVDRLNSLIKNTPTNLEKKRRQAGYSQSQLAELSTVSLRSIQMYEQRNNDISKAQFNILNALAKVLNCTVYDLVDGQ